MKKMSIYSFGLMLLLAFITMNIAILLLGSAQVFDLTPEGRYTLGEGTKTWLTKNKKNIYMRLYKSPDLQRISPELPQYADEVLKLLEQYKLHSNHKLGLQVVETHPFSAQEEEALRLGIKKLTTQQNQQTGYLGLVISDDSGNMRAIPYLNPKRKDYLEQDVSRILSNLNRRKRLDIGVLSPAFKVMPDYDALDLTPTWPAIDFLSRDYDLTYLTEKIGLIPQKMDVLLVINPTEMSNYSLYAIDQYLMRGGRVLMMLDGISEYMLNNEIMPPHLAGKSFIPDFLQRYGVIFHETTIVGDLNNGRKIANKDTTIYPFWLRLNPSVFAEHKIMQGISSLNINTAAALDVSGQEGIKTTILFGSGVEGIEVSALELAQKELTPQMKTLHRGEDMYPLGVLLEGKFSSYFMAPYISNVDKIPYISIGLKDAALMITADSDLLLSETWNANTAEQQEWYDIVPNSGNLDLLLNAIDYLSPSVPPVSVAPKQTSYAPFSLAQLFSIKAHEIMSEERTRIIEAQQKNKAEIEEIKRQVAANELLPSLPLTQKLEKLGREKMSLQQALQKNDYLTTRKYRFILNAFVVWDFVLSLSFIGLIVLVQWMLYRRTCRKIKGYVNE